MTRKEVRLQMRNGWLERGVASILLGFDLDHAKLGDLVRDGVLTTKSGQKERKGQTLYSLHDVSAITKKTPQKLLDKWFPIKRKGKQRREQETFQLKGTAAKQFRVWLDCLDRVKQMGRAKNEWSIEEVNLYDRLLYLSKRANNLNVIMRPFQTPSTGRVLRQAVDGLKEQGLLASDSDFDNKTNTWVFTLVLAKPCIDLKPVDTRKAVVFNDSSWGEPDF